MPDHFNGTASASTSIIYDYETNPQMESLAKKKSEAALGAGLSAIEEDATPSSQQYDFGDIYKADKWIENNI